MRDSEFLDIVRKFEDVFAIIEQRNRFKIGDKIEFFQPTRPSFSMQIEDIFDKEDRRIDVANKVQQILKIKTNQAVEEFSILRKI